MVLPWKDVKSVCGLALVASLNGAPLPSAARPVLEHMVHTIAHRGPDEREYFSSAQAILGFNRLSLVDPNSGSQPIHAPDGSSVLMANGEVYNHRELAATLASGATMRTRSDCEVLVHLYAEHGRRFLGNVRGMFAIMIVDLRRNKVVLARDRFGIKPLYFHRTSTRIVAASEIKALFCDPDTPRSVDWPAALGSSLLAAAPSITAQPHTTWFTGIETVAPGTVVEIDMRDGSIETHRYWAFPPSSRAGERDAAEYIAEYRRLLTESVHDCATADAEVGLFLSGGIDSAAVAAIASDVTPVQTFTAVNPGTFANGDAEFSHRIARHLGLANHQVVFDPREIPAPGRWKQVLWQLETPMCGPEAFYKHELHRYAKSVRPDLKAMLLGAASDEFNGGYSRDISADTDWSGFHDALVSMARYGGLLGHPELRSWASFQGTCLLQDATLGLGQDIYQSYLESEHRKIAQYNVWHEDRTAAGSGIEARVPFLDHRLVELVAAIPPALRADLLWDKQILRQAMSGVLPAEFVRRPKVAFFYGVGTAGVYRCFADMLRQDGASLVHEALAQPVASTMLRPDTVLAMLEQSGEAPTGELELLLRLVNIGLLEAMTADIPPARVDLPAAPLPPRYLAPEWAQAAAALPVRLGLSHSVDPSLPLELRDGVLLADSVSDPGTLLVLVDGVIEFVIDEAPGWAQVLRGIDGKTPLRELLSGADLALADVEEMLAESVREGLVSLAEPTAPAAATEFAEPSARIRVEAQPA